MILRGYPPILDTLWQLVRRYLFDIPSEQVTVTVASFCSHVVLSASSEGLPKAVIHDEICLGRLSKIHEQMQVTHLKERFEAFCRTLLDNS